MSASSSRSSRSLSPQQGMHVVDEQLRKYSECPVIVVHTYVCSGPLEGKIGETVPKIQHEYLLLDVKLKSKLSNSSHKMVHKYLLLHINLKMSDKLPYSSSGKIVHECT
jgi:hypothetical protein